ncbi:MAG: TetR/AcrR family transcriptional regulator [Chroococcidiopsidaceae cyanobacterium CP_BM_ER_R8_30]|nr:TetR/AcrR family transcriptional regulator [Chroococcidiopsidaceae cyanobacterium CP_BM_ER_R8_30]
MEADRVNQQTPKKRRTSQGERTRQSILRVAVDVASVEGLEGLTIGRLAAEIGMSKSGLFVHFGSKEELQLATVDAARAIFVAEVVPPDLGSFKGIVKLWRLCDAYCSYAERKVFRGGCFFAAAAAEFDGRPGPIRDAIATIMKEWLSTLENLVREASELGELFSLFSNVETAQLAFEINALLMGANWALQLHDDQQAFTKARAAIRQRLHSIATSTVAANV